MSSLAPPRLLKTADVAKRLGVCDRTVLRLIRRDRLPAIRFGECGPWRFHEADVDRLLEPRRAGDPT